MTLSSKPVVVGESTPRPAEPRPLDGRPTDPRPIDQRPIDQRPIDRALAFIVTFLPPAAALVALGLWWSGHLVPGPAELAILLVMQLVPLCGVELGFHRLFAHRAYKASRGLKIVLAVLGSMAFQGPALWWASIHRKHHTFSDSPEDPHSMYFSGDEPGKLTLRGMWHAHVGWIWSARSVGQGGFTRYARELYRDRDLFWIHMNYPWFLLASFLLPTLAGWAFHGTAQGALMGLLYGGFVRIFVTNHLTYWCINSVTHGVGSRDYETSDRSTNVPWLALVTWGQSYHNNHHAFPYSATMDHHWWQVDPGGWLLRVFGVLGWATDLRAPSREQIERRICAEREVA